jgi:hypothetical protein
MCPVVLTVSTALCRALDCSLSAGLVAQPANHSLSLILFRKRAAHPLDRSLQSVQHLHHNRSSNPLTHTYMQSAASLAGPPGPAPTMTGLPAGSYKSSSVAVDPVQALAEQLAAQTLAGPSASMPAAAMSMAGPLSMPMAMAMPQPQPSAAPPIPHAAAIRYDAAPQSSPAAGAAAAHHSQPHSGQPAGYVAQPIC